MTAPAHPQRPWPLDLDFNRAAKTLKIAFDDGAVFEIPFELLRVESPSAEVQGHGGAKQIVRGKADVSVTEAAPVGRYAVRIVFDDGHATGIYTWDYLHRLGQNRDALLAAHRAATGA